jgi:hypothetical protein
MLQPLERLNLGYMRCPCGKSRLEVALLIGGVAQIICSISMLSRVTCCDARSEVILPMEVGLDGQG